MIYIKLSVPSQTNDFHLSFWSSFFTASILDNFFPHYISEYDDTLQHILSRYYSPPFQKLYLHKTSLSIVSPDRLLSATTYYLYFLQLSHLPSTRDFRITYRLHPTKQHFLHQFSFRRQDNCNSILF